MEREGCVCKRDRDVCITGSLSMCVHLSLCVCVCVLYLRQHGTGECVCTCVCVCVLTLCWRAEACSTAVRKPVGKVRPASQNRVGGCAVSAQRPNCSTRWHRSLVQDASGLRDG